ncbi:MinD/ParA family ATP-binding protein [Nocardiopsis kunsanensis]|uniref:ATPase n=1 Tax=Nocardiopsis kunsanensis TaxID=141693 RepID=A0A919CKV5_9ACTN|nr:MinD/ParA family protein [Nocardiopsis kunsanensis]GHD31964.1 ATPase [Nocardiopsis kunsanensis]
MAQHEQYGPGADAESPGRDEAEEPFAEDVPGAQPSAPSPREQWFGGFEGAPPPPPPYARRPEEPRPPLTGPGPASPFRGEGAEPAEEDDEHEEAEEVRGNTVRLVPGSRPRPRRPETAAEPEADPLAPRRPNSDPEVPEPEQLPPLDTAEPPTDAPSHPAPHEPGTGPSGTTGSAPVRPGTESGSRWAPPRPPSAGIRPAEPVAPPEPGPAAPGDRGGPEPATDRGDGETAESLQAATLVRNRRQGPSGGWRRAVHNATFGLVNPGESSKVLRQRELVGRACTPVASGHHRVAVLSLKGGVGKTTTTVALGATLASLRGDRVLAVDANPDRGTLSDKVRLETAATIRDLLNERHLVSRYADIRGFTSQSPSRLEILASDRDPAVSEAFSEEDYREVSRIVEHFYSICLTDCGTGLLHSAMGGVLGLADQVVLVSSASVDGARSASATLDWLEAHGHVGLVRGAVVVLSMVRSNSKSSVDLDRLEQHFAGRCRGVVRVPWDGHLEEGAEVDLDQLSPVTKDAYLQLAASVGESFARRG